MPADQLVANATLATTAGHGPHGNPHVAIAPSSILDSYRRRAAVPPVRKTALGTVAASGFDPVTKIDGVPVVPPPLEAVSVPTSTNDV